MKIRKVLAVPGLNGFYNDDKAAIKAGAVQDGFVYRGKPVTPGFKTIRQAGECASIVLLMDDGSHAFGDALSVQYSASGGREGMHSGEELARLALAALAPALEGQVVSSFRDMTAALDELALDGAPLPASLAYGCSQAILDAVALAKRLTPAEVIASEYGLEMSASPIRINSQSGDDRYVNVDKMILKKAGFMPHGLLNNARDKVGLSGEKLLAYAQWVRDRIVDLGEPGYAPTLRFDVYGTIGEVFGNDTDRVAGYLAELYRVTRPFDLFVEMPVDMGDSAQQMRAMRAIREKLARRATPVKLIIDEYANTLEEIRLWADSGACDMIQVKTPDLGSLHKTVEAVLHCKTSGVLAYLGGSCTDTDQSARLCANIALATEPFAVCAKPGMGVDEAMMIVNNEMRRVLQIAHARKRLQGATLS